MVEIICAACGEKVHVQNSPRRKYCDICKTLTENQRQSMRHQREQEARDAAEKLLELQRQADPFDYRLMSDKRLGAVIKMFRMTYGTYTAAYRSGILPQLLKAKGFADPEKMLREMEIE